MKLVELGGNEKDDETIKTLEVLLEKAKAGELVSLIYVDKYLNGDAGHGWSGRPDHLMVGKIEDLFNFFSQAYVFPDPAKIETKKPLNF